MNRTTISENPDMFATDISIAALNSIFSLNISLSFRTPRSNLAALQQPTVLFFRASAVHCQIASTDLREALCAERPGSQESERSERILWSQLLGII
ncbi:MAG: hypothetical protein KDD58_15850 [Bdellovibrionales bacterium]|nr:hypothetical protein [Bdellovibrionales bacterium]